MRNAAARADHLEQRRQHWTRHEHAGHAFGDDRLHDSHRIENRIVEHDVLRAAEHVGHHRLRAARPLQRVNMQVHVIGADRRDGAAEGVEMLEVVDDERVPRTVRYHPRLGKAGGAGGELDGADRFIVDVAGGIIALASRNDRVVRDGPARDFRADRDEMLNRLHFGAVRLQLWRKAGIEE
ncbi:MAG TPA: hypothetical protein VGU20_28020 [Stellaceae bacterium]|nr:hypothetical protein [Stellaceae bacterium]